MNQLLLLLLLTSVITTLSSYVPVKGHKYKPLVTVKSEDAEESNISENDKPKIDLELNQSSGGIENNQQTSFGSILKDHEQKLNETHNHKDITVSGNSYHEKEIDKENHHTTNIHEENHHSKGPHGEQRIYRKTTENRHQGNVVVREQMSSGGDIISSLPSQSKVEDRHQILLTDDQHTHKILEDNENNQKVNEEESSHLVHSSKSHHSFPDNVNNEQHKTVLTLEKHDHEKDLHRHGQIDIRNDNPQEKIILNNFPTPSTIRPNLSVRDVHHQIESHLHPGYLDYKPKPKVNKIHIDQQHASIPSYIPPREFSSNVDDNTNKNEHKIISVDNQGGFIEIGKTDTSQVNLQENIGSNNKEIYQKADDSKQVEIEQKNVAVDDSGVGVSHIPHKDEKDIVGHHYFGDKHFYGHHMDEFQKHHGHHYYPSNHEVKDDENQGGVLIKTEKTDTSQVNLEENIGSSNKEINQKVDDGKQVETEQKTVIVDDSGAGIAHIPHKHEKDIAEHHYFGHKDFHGHHTDDYHKHHGHHYYPSVHEVKNDDGKKVEIEQKTVVVDNSGVGIAHIPQKHEKDIVDHHYLNDKHFYDHHADDFHRHDDHYFKDKDFHSRHTDDFHKHHGHHFYPSGHEVKNDENQGVLIKKEKTDTTQVNLEENIGSSNKEIKQKVDDGKQVEMEQKTVVVDNAGAEIAHIPHNHKKDVVKGHHYFDDKHFHGHHPAEFHKHHIHHIYPSSDEEKYDDDSDSYEHKYEHNPYFTHPHYYDHHISSPPHEHGKPKFLHSSHHHSH